MTNQTETTAAEATSSADDDAPLLSDISDEAAQAEGIVQDEGKEDGDGEGETRKGELMTPDVFYETIFNGALSIPNVVLTMQRKDPLQSLDAALTDPNGRAASDAIYASIKDVPMLHFLIAPESEWMQRAWVVAAFALPTGRAVASELSERRAAAKAAATRTSFHTDDFKPANDDIPTPESVIVSTQLGDDEE